MRTNLEDNKNQVGNSDEIFSPLDRLMPERADKAKFVNREGRAVNLNVNGVYTPEVTKKTCGQAINQPFLNRCKSYCAQEIYRVSNLNDMINLAKKDQDSVANELQRIRSSISSIEYCGRNKKRYFFDRLTKIIEDEPRLRDICERCRQIIEEAKIETFSSWGYIRLIQESELPISQLRPIIQIMDDFVSSIQQGRKLAYKLRKYQRKQKFLDIDLIFIYQEIRHLEDELVAAKIELEEKLDRYLGNSRAQPHQKDAVWQHIIA